MSQKFEAMLAGTSPTDPITNVTMHFDDAKTWEDVWLTVENAAKTLGFSYVAGMRAVEPLASAWMPEHMFDSYAKQRAREKAYRTS